MRQALILLALFAVPAGPAFAVQDRYGPPRADTVHTDRVAPSPTGPMLRWTGKSTATQEAIATAEPLRPAPLAPWAERLSATPAAAPAEVAPAPQRLTPAAAPSPVQPVSQPVRMTPSPAVSAPLPYAARAAVAPAPMQQAPAVAPTSPPVAYAARTALPAAAPVATPQAPGAAARPRFYSVARQYGAEPDPIPAPTVARRGEVLTLGETPVSEPLGRSYAPLDDARSNQAVAIPDTKQNAASNRISRLGL